ncbi:MerR family transcriptional regulator [Paractinoplanes atraurantiacus]|uniref:DNA-binding transcriptional regulator, MerR family n=1 Tax=Paractinoplanes atraurantiacus TaxID=1036182 RepID=A0A285JK72_9ACTN|nr:MerR family transcriptional regulator [Actinoplanes atraurantiacus]SNY59491.1 DNA-binding transcriptional regulator, MerR family [Actinoplanes atraurantiacus]
MRVKELADLTGTTVRTIRYYHQIGLVPVPERCGGHRDYDLVHVARLVRIRWLAQAGIPLATIAVMLGDQAPAAATPDLRRQSVLADLRAGVSALEQQLLELQAQRDRMRRLIAGVERDGHLSPMPPAVASFYDRMQTRAADEKTRRVIRQERDFMELAFYRGDMPVESAVVYEKLTEAGLADSIALFGQIAEREEHAGSLGEREMDRIATAVVDRLTRHMGADVHDVLKSIDLGLARRAADLYVRLAEPHQRRLARTIGDALLTTIEKGQADDGDTAHP